MRKGPLAARLMPASLAVSRASRYNVRDRSAAVPGPA